jgi:hypothetical protein
MVGTVKKSTETAHQLAALRCENSILKEKRKPRKDAWRLTVPTGRYSFFADFKKSKYKVQPFIDEIVRPPCWGKPLKVQS